MYSDEDLLMISGLQHLAFCERQWALIHLEQLWAESIDTARGEVFHQRAHLEGYSIKRGVKSERGFRLVSYQLGLSGIADIVEFTQDQESKGAVSKCAKISPVEYKVGKPKTSDWDRIQLCAQALCLEEMLESPVTEGFLFYGKTKRRETITIDSELRVKVEQLALRMHELYQERKLPKAIKSAKCKRCSLVDLCVPSASSLSATSYWNEAGFSEERVARA